MGKRDPDAWRDIQTAELRHSSPKPFCGHSEAKGLAWYLPNGRKNLFSQFLISKQNSQPWRNALILRSQSRAGVALCCPLAYIPCPALSPLTQPRAEQGKHARPSRRSFALWGLVTAITGHPQEWGTAPEPGWGKRGQVWGSLSSVQATFAQHTPHGANWGWGEWGLLLAQEPAPAWTLSLLLTCSRSGYTRHTQTQSLSGLRGLWPPWTTWAP